LTKLFIALFLFFFPLLSQSAASLRVADDGLSAGYVTLAWDNDNKETIAIEQSMGNGWKTIYQGLDKATTLSGLSDGDYFFRLKHADGSYSNQISLEVKHHTRAKAFGFFGLGAFMFVILLIMIFRGTRNGSFAEIEASR